MMSKRYIVYQANKDNGYYERYIEEKESNQISDIVAILRNEERAKEMVKDDEYLDYKEVIWEE